MLNARIINAPRPEVVAMLKRRMPPEAREKIGELRFDAIGLIQTTIPNIYFFADVGQKAASVYPVEITGSCPQHISTLAFFGETTAVKTAMKAVEQQEIRK